MRPTLATATLLLALGAAPAGAAESYDNCTGFVDSLPATLATQGTWCLRADLSTNLSSGAAITLANNNITLDCNGFKLGGLGGGPTTTAVGVGASNRLNTTVRGCSIRGFRIGVAITSLEGSGGHVIEDNRFDGQTVSAIVLYGDGNLIRRNLVNDVGPPPNSTDAWAMYTSGGVDILDNAINGVVVSTGRFAYGILSGASDSIVVRGNRVRGLANSGTGVPYGVYIENQARASIRDNDLFAPAGVGIGVACQNGNSVAADNTIAGFNLASVGCTASGNLPPP